MEKEDSDSLLPAKDKSQEEQMADKAKALERALQLIDSHEQKEEEDIKIQKDVQKEQLNQIEDNFLGLGEELSFFASKNGTQNDLDKSIKEVKKDERMSLSHSTIVGNDSFRPSQGGGGFYDTGFDKDDFDFK